MGRTTQSRPPRPTPWTKQGKTCTSERERCGGKAELWPPDAHPRLVDPERCWRHMPIKHVKVLFAYINTLSPEERPQRRQRISATASLGIDRTPLTGVAGADYPACWTWPFAAVRMHASTLRGNKEALWVLFRDWHQNRCAICGGSPAAELLRDHGHISGLIRGLLCRRCNVLEGKGQSPVVLAYRKLNSALLLGIELEYKLIHTETSVDRRGLSVATGN